VKFGIGAQGDTRDVNFLPGYCLCKIRTSQVIHCCPMQRWLLSSKWWSLC